MKLVRTFLLTITACVLIACGQAEAPVAQQPPTPNTASAQPSQAPMPATVPAQPATTPPPDLPAATSMASSHPRQVVIDAVKALDAAGPYRVVQRMESASGTTESLVEIVPPDRRRVVVGDGIEMITIGTRRWSKIDGVWTEQPSDGGLPLVGLSAEQLAGGLLANPLDLGTEAVNGTQARVYAFEGTSDISGVTASQALTVWIDASMGLPLKVEADVVAQGVSTKMSMTYEYSDTIVIEPPAT